MKSYKLLIENGYFEPIDSIAIDGETVCTNIEIEDTVICRNRISNSIHKLVCYTRSNLKLTIQFNAISKHEQIVAIIHSDGSISLR